MEIENREIEGSYESTWDTLINIVFNLGGDRLKLWKMITTLVEVFVSEEDIFRHSVKVSK